MSQPWKPRFSGVVLMALLLAGTASASTWCGQNGVMRLSFSAGDSIVAVTTAEPGSAGKTIVAVYVVLDEVEPVSRDGERFLGIGGFEARLTVDGATDFTIKAAQFDYQAFNLARITWQCRVGILDGLILQDGRAILAYWIVIFNEPPRNVVFRLDPKGTISCETMSGCSESHPYALYTGTVTSNQAGSMFGTGYVPAYLNWEGEPDLAPVLGTNSWREVGVYQSSEPPRE